MSEPQTDSPPGRGWLWRDRPVFLMVSLFLLLLVYPLFEDQAFAGRIVAGLFTLIMISAALAVMQDRRLATIMAIVGVPTIVLRWCVEFLRIEGLAATLSGVLVVVFLIFVVGVLVASLLRTQTVAVDTLCRAVAAYLLMGFAWAVVYETVGLLDPGAFSVPSGDTSWGRAVYFSFTTLTTLGYGDITPVSPVARSFVVTEAIIGPLYLAILLARLMGLFVTQSRDRQGASDAQ